MNTLRKTFRNIVRISVVTLSFLIVFPSYSVSGETQAPKLNVPFVTSIMCPSLEAANGFFEVMVNDPDATLTVEGAEWLAKKHTCFFGGKNSIPTELTTIVKMQDNWIIAETKRGFWTVFYWGRPDEQTV